MNFVYNIAVYNCSDDEIRLAIPRVMKTWEYDFAPGEILEKTEYISENLVPSIDKALMLRKFLISPGKNKWSIIYHTLNWFSEAQLFGVQLSQELESIVLVFLLDDSYGWGYELSQNGQVLDKFHTNPYSPTLHERDGEFGFEAMIERNIIEPPPPESGVEMTDVVKLMMPSPDEMTDLAPAMKASLLKKLGPMLDTLNPEQRKALERKLEESFEQSMKDLRTALPTPEEKSQLIKNLPDPTLVDRLRDMGKASPEEMTEYQGHPLVVADLFGIDSDKLTERLQKSRDSYSIFAHDEMHDFLEEDLGIEDWYKGYQEFLDDLDSLKDWHHLIFSKQMTAVELNWCKLGMSQNIMPDTGPPIWINQQ